MWSMASESWFQAVPLLKSPDQSGPPNVSLDENGTMGFRFSQGPQIAVLPPLNGAKKVDIRNAPLVFVGYGVDAPERGWNDFKGVRTCTARSWSSWSTIPIRGCGWRARRRQVRRQGHDLLRPLDLQI